MSVIETLIESASENLGKLILVGGGYIAAAEAGMVGYPPMPGLPGWWPLIGLLVGSVLVVGWIVASRIGDLIEDEEDDEWDVIVREIKADETDCGTYGFSAEGFGEAVIYGDLRYLADAPGSADVYDAYDVNAEPGWTDNPGYDEDRDPSAVIYGTYLGQEPDASLVGHYDGADARREIGRIKEEYEDLAAAGRILIEHYPAILRRLDRDRAIRWVQRLGGDISGDVGDTSDVDEAIKETLPMDLIPAPLLDEDELTESESGDDEDVGDPDRPSLGQAIATLVDEDPSDLEADSGPAVADGGQTDE